jgi:putative endonuclease
MMDENSSQQTDDYHIYVLLCQDETLFTGVTKNLPRTIAEQRSGRGDSYVAGRLPCTLVFTEKHSSRWRAWKRERQIRRMSQERKMKYIRRAMDVGRSDSEESA